MKYIINNLRPTIARTTGLALVLALAVSFIGLTHADTFYSLTVNVSDACGPVVAQVTVVNGPDDGAFGVTNAQGQFVFDSLHAGVFYLHIAAANNISQDSDTIVLDTNKTVSFNLNRVNADCGPPPGGEDTFNLTVNVNDICGPVVAQVVIVNGPDDGAFGITNSSGSFTFTNLNAGVFYLHIAAADHASYDSDAIVLDANKTVSFNLDRTNGDCGPPIIEDTFRLTVNVSDICAPISGALVTIVGGPQNGNSETTNSNGTAIFNNLDPADFYVHVTAADHNSKDSDNIHLDSDKTISLSLDRTNGGCGPTPEPTNQAPIGWLDGANCEIIGGWVVDLNTPNQAVTVEIYANGPVGSGIQIFSGLTTGLRQDVNSHYGISGNHGYTILTPASLKDANTHQIYAYALDTTDHSRVQLLGSPKVLGPCGSIPTPTNQAPIGWLDGANCEIIGGWAVDMDTPNEGIPVHLYYDGPAGSGTFLTDVWPNTPRPDVNSGLGISGVHGFTIATPQVLKDGNSHLVYAYGIDSDPSHALNAQLNGSPKTVYCPPAAVGTIAMVKSVRNVTQGQGIFTNSVSASPTETVEFKIEVTASNGAVSNVSVSDTLPGRLNYVNNSLTVDGAATGNNLAGITLGNLNNNQTKTIVFRATVADASQFSVGNTLLTNTASGTSASNSTSASASVTVGVNPSALTCSPSGQNVLVNQIASLTASGGVGSYQWSAPGGNPASGSGSSFSTQYSTQGNKSVSLTSDGVVVNCTVSVADVQVGTIAMVKSVRNVTQGQSVFTNSISGNPTDTVEFKITVAASNGPVNNVVVSDSLPARLNYVNNSLSIDGNIDGNNLAGIALGNLNANQTKTILFRATVADASQFSVGNTLLTNTASGTSASNSTSASASVTVGVNPTQVSLAITKLVRNLTQGQSTYVNSTGARPGDQVQFQIQVTNTGNTSAQNVSVYDVPNQAFTLTSGSNTTNLGNLNPGSTQTITLSATIASDSYFSCGLNNVSNTATVQATNSNFPSASATMNVNRTNNCDNNFSSLNISKSVRNLSQGQNLYSESVSANPGDQVQFQIQVTVSGNQAAQNVNVSDSLPGNLFLSSGSTSFNLGTMNVGSVQTVTLSATVANSANFNCNAATLTNTATVSSSNSGSNSDQASVFVNATGSCIQNNNASLTLTKEVRNLTSNSGFFSSSTSANNGDQVQFRLTVRNNSLNTTANNVRLTDFLPNGLSYVTGSFQSDGSASGNLFGGTEFLGSMFGGQSRTITFNATVNASTGQSLTNIATASADNASSVNGQAAVNLGSVLGGNIALVQSKRAFNQTRNADATTTSAQPGDIIVYTLSVANQGNVPATNYVFQDDIFDVLQLSQLQDFSDGTFNLGSLSLSWPALTINSGATITKTFTVKVNSSFPAGSDNVMTNTFGNTVNVQVNKPVVAGAYVAPKTGPTTNLTLLFAFLTLGAFVARKQKAQLKQMIQKLKGRVA